MAQAILVTLGQARLPWALGRARNGGAVSISLSQSALSTQDVQVQVVATTAAGAPYDPTGDVVQMAFVPVSFPQSPPATWVTASWVTDAGGNYWATCLVGPANGGTVLAAGSYICYVKVTDSPSVPVLPGPTLSIF